MTVRFLLFRHAEAEGNAAGRTQGRIDHELTERGRRQAGAAPAALAPWRPVALYASPAARARATAAPLAAALGFAAVADERLHEVDHGELDGLAFAEIRERHPAFLARWRDEALDDLRFPGGESMGEARARMREALEEYAARHGEADIAVVSHNLALKALLTWALGVPLAAQRRLHLDLASLSIAERHAGEDGGPPSWSVPALNDRCHLEGAGG